MRQAKFNYYKDQLNRLRESEFYKTVQFSDGIGNKTNTLSLSPDSIPILLKFLENELKSLRAKKETICKI